MKTVVSQHLGTCRTLPQSLILVLWLAVGCTSIPDEIALVVESTPSGVNVVSSDGWECRTPCTRSVSRDSQFDLKLIYQGYESVEQAIEIPELRPYRVGPYIGASIGVLMGLTSVYLGR